MTAEARKQFFDDHYFVMLGAASAIGPYECLLKMGATVVGIDLNQRPRTWERLVNLARRSAGTLFLPASKPQSELRDDEALFSAAGANLITQAPELAAWLTENF